MFRKILFIAGLLGNAYSPPKPQAAGAPLTNRPEYYILPNDHETLILNRARHRFLKQGNLSRYLHDDAFTISRAEAPKVITLNPHDTLLRRHMKEDFTHEIRFTLCEEQDTRSLIRLEEMIGFAQIQEEADTITRSIEERKKQERLRLEQEAERALREEFTKFRTEIQASREYVNLKKALRSLIDKQYGIIHAKLGKLGAILYAFENESNARKINNIFLSLNDRILGLISSEDRPEFLLDLEQIKYCSERLSYYIKQIDLVNLEGTMLGDILTKITNPEHTVKPATQAYLSELQDIIRKTQVFSNAMSRLESLYMPHSMDFDYSSMSSAGMIEPLHQIGTEQAREIVLPDELAQLVEEMNMLSVSETKSDPDTQAPAAAAAEEESVSDYTLPTNTASDETKAHIEMLAYQLKEEREYSKDLEDQLAEYKRLYGDIYRPVESVLPEAYDLSELSREELEKRFRAIEEMNRVLKTIQGDDKSKNPIYWPGAKIHYNPPHDDGAASESTTPQQDVVPPEPAGVGSDIELNPDETAVAAKPDSTKVRETPELDAFEAKYGPRKAVTKMEIFMNPDIGEQIDSQRDIMSEEYYARKPIEREALAFLRNQEIKFLDELDLMDDSLAESEKKNDQ